MTETAYGQPQSYNPLSKINYKFMIKRLPAVNYNVQKVNIPSVQLPPATMATPFVDMPMHGDKIQFGELNVDFLLDENFQNHKEIFTWMKELGFPKSHSQHANALNKKIGTGEGLYSDATLTILNSARNKNVEIIFYNLWPTGLSSLDFDLTIEQVDYLNVSASFAYTSYDFI